MSYVPDSQDAHVAFYAVTAAGEEGVTRDALLARPEITRRLGDGGGPVGLLVANGMTSKQAEMAMRDPAQERKASQDYFLHVIDKLVKSKRLIDTDGVLTIGKLPRGYDPVKFETNEGRGIAAVNLAGARRTAGGWTYYVNPDLDEGAVERLAESMRRVGWPKGETVLLDADDQVADGKHHIAAAQLAGVAWEEHTIKIPDELALWQEVKKRNIDRSWQMSKKEIVAKHAKFMALRPDLAVTDRMKALRENLVGVSERTQQRATSEAKQQTLVERDAIVKAGIADGKTQRQVAEETKVPKSTVADIVKKDDLPETRQNGGNRAGEPSVPEVVGTCCVCHADIVKGEKTADRLIVREGFDIFGSRSGGGYNAIHGGFEKTGEIAHHGCTSVDAQVAFRAREAA